MWRRAAEATQEPEREHLRPGLCEAAACVEEEVDEVGVLEDGDAAVDFAQRGEDEGALGVAEEEDCHDELPLEAFVYIEFLADGG